jgi:hypothetical protein
VRSGTNWTQQAYLKASNASRGAGFGGTIAISGDTVAVGSSSESRNAIGVNGDGPIDSASSSGAAYIFVRSGTNWTQQAYCKASNTGAGDRFGIGVAVSGDMVVVGAWAEDSNATGVNGDQTNNASMDAGACYVFVRSGTNWSQQAYLKAPNTDVLDYFGYSVAVSDGTIVAGAWQEDSDAKGVNGDQTNNSAGDSGAVYVFTSAAIGPTLSIAPDGGGGYFVRGTA